MRSYPVSENPIGSAVSEILWYRQTDIVLLCIIDGYRISGYIDRVKFVLNSVRSSSRRVRDGVKGMSSWEYVYIRMHGNLVQHPSNNIYINF